MEPQPSIEHLCAALTGLSKSQNFKAFNERWHKLQLLLGIPHDFTESCMSYVDVAPYVEQLPDSVCGGVVTHLSHAVAGGLLLLPEYIRSRSSSSSSSSDGDGPIHGPWDCVDLLVHIHGTLIHKRLVSGEDAAQRRQFTAAAAEAAVDSGTSA
jgi:hypothetical protein